MDALTLDDLDACQGVAVLPGGVGDTDLVLDLATDEEEFYRRHQKFGPRPPNTTCVGDDEVALNFTQVRCFATMQTRYGLAEASAGIPERPSDLPSAAPFTFNVMEDLCWEEAPMGITTDPRSKYITGGSARTAALRHSTLENEEEVVFSDITALPSHDTLEETEVLAEANEHIVNSFEAKDPEEASPDWFVLDPNGRVVQAPLTALSGCPPTDPDKAVRPLPDDEDELRQPPPPAPPCMAELGPQDLLPSARPGFGRLPVAEDSPLRPETFHVMYTSLMTVLNQYR